MSESLVNLINRTLDEVVTSHPGPHTVLLSGGIDSMLLAAALSKTGAPVKAVTFEVVLPKGATPYASDAPAARACARFLELEHEVLSIRLPELVAMCDSAMEVLETDEVFEVGCAVVVAACVAAALPEGTVWTGDGADALFGGGRPLPTSDAAWQKAVDDTILKARTPELWPIPDFYERVLGANFSRFKQAFRDDAFIPVAKACTVSDLWVAGIEKHALRLAGVARGLPTDLAFQAKNPQQNSSGVIAGLEALQRLRVLEKSNSKTYRDPWTEPAQQTLARLWLSDRSK